MAWYNYPLIGGFGTYPDPAGNYPKPDINIIVPAGTPFTAPASGTVTNIDTSSSYGTSITVQFDNPPNTTALYYAFNYMSSIASGVGVGQHVNAGDILAYGGGGINNSGINTTAFAFSAGPAYGQGTGWTNNVIGSWINPSLDPSSYITSLQKGITLQTTSTKCTCDAGYTVIIGGVGQQVCRNQSFPYDTRPCKERGITDPITSIANFLNNLQALGPWLADPMRILKLVAGLMLVALSIYLLVTQQGPEIIQKAVKAVS